VINTKLLNTVADLTENKLDITRALNSSDGCVPQDSERVAKTRDKEERAPNAAYVQLQARAIESLRIELFMLKRKDTSSLTMPTPIPPQGSTTIGGGDSQSFGGLGGGTSNAGAGTGSFLPPIPSAKK
jgi:hypothetical protein